MSEVNMPTHIVVDGEQPIPQHLQDTMQQDAVAVSREITPAVSAPDQPKQVEDILGFVNFGQIAITPMVILDMTCSEMFSDMKDLKAVPTGCGLVNIYNPLRKAGMRGEEVVHEGLLRSSMLSVLAVANRVNNANIVMPGQSANAYHETMRAVVKRLVSDIENVFPFGADSLIAEYTIDGDDENDTVHNVVRFNDIVSVRAWFNSVSDDSAMSVFDHNIIVNFNVNAPALYDSADKLKFIVQSGSILTNILRKAESPTMLFGVKLSASDLASTEIRELLDLMIDTEGFALYSSRDLVARSGDSDWVPPTKVGVERDLMNAGDILLLKILSGTAVKEEATEKADS